MARKLKTPHEPVRGAQSTEIPRSDDDRTILEETLVVVRRHIDEGNCEKALSLIARSPIKSDWLSNAAAVCQIRLGKPDVALDILRRLVLQKGILMRQDAPPTFKLNFAAALLASGNLDGFLSTMNELDDQAYPEARKYNEAYHRWKSSLTLWDRLKSSILCRPSRPFIPDFPLGELN